MDHHDVFKLITAEIAGHERDSVLEGLAAAYVAAYDDEVDEEKHAADHEVLDSVEAHFYFVDAYYKAGPELRAKPRTKLDPDATYREVNPREVSVPDWAPTHRRLLRALAHHQRRHDDAALVFLNSARV